MRISDWSSDVCSSDLGGVGLLSDIDGLYDRNPAQPGAQHIARVERVDAAIEAMADGKSASGMGSGGMVSKIAAARIANAAGAHLAHASHQAARPLSTDARHPLFVTERVSSDTTSVLTGTRMPVRLELGGTENTTNTQQNLK